MKTILSRLVSVVLIIIFLNMSLKANSITFKIISLILTVMCLIYLLYDFIVNRIGSPKFNSIIDSDKFNIIKEIAFYLLLMGGSIIIAIATYVIPLQSTILKIFYYLLSCGGIFICTWHIILKTRTYKKIGKE
jgi:hypothetical protein